MQQIHDEVQRHIDASNETYKAHADIRRFLDFSQGDVAMYISI